MFFPRLCCLKKSNNSLLNIWTLSSDEAKSRLLQPNKKVTQENTYTLSSLKMFIRDLNSSKS